MCLMLRTGRVRRVRECWIGGGYEDQNEIEIGEM